MIQKKSIHATKTQWQKICIDAWLRDLGICQLCGLPIQGVDCMAPHHIIPKGRLHVDHIDNTLCTCAECHRMLHDGNLEITVNDVIERYRDRVSPWLEGER